MQVAQLGSLCCTYWTGLLEWNWTPKTRPDDNTTSPGLDSHRTTRPLDNKTLAVTVQALYGHPGRLSCDVTPPRLTCTDWWFGGYWEIPPLCL